MRWDILNKFIAARGYKKYLEIGVKNGDNFKLVEAPFKAGVDPDRRSAASYHMTSDEYFKLSHETYDIVFIDGLHLCEQVYKDIQNALSHLSLGGAIVLHDMLPATEAAQSRAMQVGVWNGDCWKAFVRCRKELPYRCYTIDEDYGCSVIDTVFQNTADKSKLPDGMLELTWQQFCKSKKEWMDIVSMSQVCWSTV